MSGTSLLELEGITKQFGELVAVDDVSFTIDDGAGITALIGPNGAGKTTMYNVMTGMFNPTSGRILFHGEDLTGDTPAERTRKGLGRSFQITNVFEGLTVRQNLRIPVIARSGARRDPMSRIEANEPINREADRVLDLVGLRDIATQPCKNLSYGDKRRVEIGITLATDPSLVLLDEPTAGMNIRETEAMVELLQDLDAETDTSFFITEHDMNVVFTMASRIIVLHQGAVIADGSPEQIQRDQEVERAYLGSDEGFEEKQAAMRGRADSRETTGSALLEVDDIHTYYGQSHVLTGVSLDVHEGEIVSILGRNGAGKTTTLRSIVGLQPPRQGEVRFNGEVISGNQPYQIARAGIGFVPEERRIFTDLTVEDNLEIILDDSSDWTVEQLYDLFPRLGERAQNKGYQLSGGEQQMLTIARVIGADPTLLVLDEPSEGLAPVIVDDLHDILSEIIDMGMTVLLTEQNVEFSLALAERNYIIANGHVEWEGTTEELLDNREAIERYISLSGVGEDEQETVETD